MPEELSPDHPNLISAAQRMQRICWAWATVSLLFAVLTYGTVGETYPLAALPWLLHGLLLVRNQQPLFLGLTAVLWGISVLNLLPGISGLVGPDPLTVIFETSVIEKIAFGVVRFLLLLMAWNQFMFYRILYGTAEMNGLDDDLPIVPEIILNWSDVLAVVAPAIGILGMVTTWVTVLPTTGTLRTVLAEVAYACIIFSIGLGIGVTFSPTSRRRLALFAVGLGLLSFASLSIVGRL
jgi:hypothetical protein